MKMGRQIICVIVALFTLLGPGAFADDPAPAGALTCRICNDALGAEYACTKAKPAKVESMPCNSLADVGAATSALKNLGTGLKVEARQGGTANALKPMRMWTEYMKSIRVAYAEATNGIKFACRRYSVEIGENKDTKGKRRERVVGTCGMYIPEHDHEDSHLDCVTKAGSAKTKFISCKCDSKDCNGAGRLSQGVNALLIVCAFIWLLASFKRVY